jgi:hypothetical protein
MRREQGSPVDDWKLATCTLVVLAALGTCSAALGAQPPDPFEVIKSADSFKMGPVGYGGTTSREEYAFRKLLKEPDAARQFRALLRTGTTAAQLYGLLGLKLSKDPGFERAYRRFVATKRQVHIVEGCLGSEEDARAVAREIRDGRVK